MTLIAGFLSYRSPFLVGDLLITGVNRLSLRKKILIVADNFALAWTGDLLAAQSIVETLQASLDIGDITVESIKNVLIDPDTSDHGILQATIIGWVVDTTGQHCFRWNSSYPGELFFGNPLYDGSGTSFAEKHIGPQGINSDSDIDSDSHISSVLNFTTSLMRWEMLGPSTQSIGFGFCYEIIYFSKEAGFQYVDNILYLSVTLIFNDQGEYLDLELNGNVFKYNSEDNFSVVHMLNCGRDTRSVYPIKPIGRISNLKFNAFARGYEKKAKKAFNNQHRTPLLSDYYCVFITFKAPGFISPPTSIVVPARVAQIQNGIAITIASNNSLSITFAPLFAEAIYKQIRADQEGSSTV